MMRKHVVELPGEPDGHRQNIEDITGPRHGPVGIKHGRPPQSVDEEDRRRKWRADYLLARRTRQPTLRGGDPRVEPGHRPQPR